MKLNKYSWLAIFPMIFSACQDDVLVENQQNEIYTLSAQMGEGATLSRAQIQLGNMDANVGEFFFWNEGDKFTLYQGDKDNYTEHVFNIKDYSEKGEGDKKVASFVTDNPVMSGKEVIGVYPSGLRMDYDQDIMRVAIDFQTELDFSQGTVEEVWKDYFRNNMVMRTKAILSEGAENTLRFEHLTSLARITYHNQSGKDQNVTEIVLGGDQHFGYLMTVWFKYDIVGGNFNNGYRINYKNLTVKNGESFDFYILFGPDDLGNGDMHFHIHTAETDNNRSPLALPLATIAATNGNATKFEPGKRYWFKVTETENGLAWTKDLSTDMVTIENAELSKALAGVLGAEKVSINAQGYAEMNKTDVDAVKTLDFNNKGYTITSLAGIEKFANLEELRCGSVGLVSCDLSKNKLLKFLVLSGNPMEELDISNNANLEVLYVEACEKMTTLKLDNCYKLGFVSMAYSNSLSFLNIPDKGRVYNLNFSHTKLHIDLSEYRGLSVLKCSFAGMTELNLSKEAKSKLTQLECEGNNLTSLDLTECVNLKNLNCVSNQLATLDLSACTELTNLRCSKNQLASIDVKHLVKLVELDIIDNQLTSLDVSSLVNLKGLHCFGNHLEALDLSACGGLETMQLGCQIDSEGKDIILKLKLADSSMDAWTGKWVDNGFNKNVELDASSNE